jgi:hypothetical protein
MDELSTTDACTLPTAERPLRLAEFDALFRDSARSVAWQDVAVRINLAGPRGLKERVRDLAERETQVRHQRVLAPSRSPNWPGRPAE